MRVEPYLSLDGRCEDAIEFYKKSLGAQVEMIMRFKDSPDPGMFTPGMEEKIMHASFKIGETTIMASDGRCNPDTELKGFNLAIQADSIDEAERLFAALSDGGTVTMPIEETFWSPRFGMVTDKFGVHWMVDVATA